MRRRLRPAVERQRLPEASEIPGGALRGELKLGRAEDAQPFEKRAAHLRSLDGHGGRRVGARIGRQRTRRSRQAHLGRATDLARRIVRGGLDDHVVTGARGDTRADHGRLLEIDGLGEARPEASLLEPFRAERLDDGMGEPAVDGDPRHEPALEPVLPSHVVLVDLVFARLGRRGRAHMEFRQLRAGRQRVEAHGTQRLPVCSLEGKAESERESERLLRWKSR